MIRTRFAPSPTGYMHIGNLRTALYAYLFARHNGGTFILRIEDTDRKRNIPQAVRAIYNSLKLAKLEHDEGPDLGGDFGPYVQSQRKEIYQRYAAEALEKGLAYRCFCSGEKKDAVRVRKQERRDPCRYLPPAEVQNKLELGIPSVVRQMIPDAGTSTFTDHVFGVISVSHSDLDDQVLLKSDGFPTYNFANVVDDHLMQITHVIRGVEYLSSTPKYNLLYEGFGWDIPEYIHLPLITKEGGRKLSKREGDASFEDLLAKGYLAEAVVNYIALLGWNPGNDREFFSLDDLVKEFDIDRINKSKSAFSLVKLDWLNGQHMRALSLDQFHQLAIQFYPASVSERYDLFKISCLIQPRVIHLTDIPGIVGFLGQLPDYDINLFTNEKSKSTFQSSRLVLNKIAALLGEIEESGWTNLVIQEKLKGLAAGLNLKVGTVMWPLRIAISGLSVTPGGATEIAEILGKTETLQRISLAAARLSAQA